MTKPKRRKKSLVERLMGNKCLTCLGKGKQVVEYYEGGDPWLDGDMFGFDTNTYKVCSVCKGTGRRSK